MQIHFINPNKEEDLTNGYLVGLGISVFGKTEILKGLKIGEFVALASLRVNNHLQKNAIIVKAEFKG